MPKLWGQRCGVDQLGKTVVITAGFTVGAQYKFSTMSVGLENRLEIGIHDLHICDHSNIGK